MDERREVGKLREDYKSTQLISFGETSERNLSLSELTQTRNISTDGFVRC